jgi:hypothetical protein
MGSAIIPLWRFQVFKYEIYEKGRSMPGVICLGFATMEAAREAGEFDASAYMFHTTVVVSPMTPSEERDSNVLNGFFDEDPRFGAGEEGHPDNYGDK